jgi:hypothetical protein
MSFTSLEYQLDLLERQFNEVSSALIDGDPVAVESNCLALQQLAVDFVQIADELGQSSLDAGHLTIRIQALAEGLPTLRQNLLRRSSFVERALELLVPAMQQTTYSKNPSPYGKGVQQSGQFKVFSA